MARYRRHPCEAAVADARRLAARVGRSGPVTPFESRRARAELRRSVYAPDPATAVEARDNLTAIYQGRVMPPDIATMYAELTDAINRRKET